MTYTPKTRSLVDLAAECEAWRAEGKTIVWTNGCYDILHAGHVRALEEARSLGDVLIVGLNSDRSVRELKGPDRPLNKQRDRAVVMSALEPVTRVLVFDGKRCDRELAALKPDIWTKSGDYTEESLDAAERAAVHSYGGRIVIAPLVPGVSTTLLVKKIRRADPEKIISAACCFIRDDQNRVLMVATRYPDGLKWGLPAGGHNHGESLPENARRETLEETGQEVDIIRYLGVIERMEPLYTIHLTLHVFEARISDPERTANETFEHSDAYVEQVAWFSRERLETEKTIVLGRRIWLDYLDNTDAWPPYILMKPGEEYTEGETI